MREGELGEKKEVRRKIWTSRRWIREDGNDNERDTRRGEG